MSKEEPKVRSHRRDAGAPMSMTCRRCNVHIGLEQAWLDIFGHDDVDKKIGLSFTCENKTCGACKQRLVNNLIPSGSAKHRRRQSTSAALLATTSYSHGQQGTPTNVESGAMEEKKLSKCPEAGLITILEREQQ